MTTAPVHLRPVNDLPADDDPTLTLPRVERQQVLADLVKILGDEHVALTDIQPLATATALLCCPLIRTHPREVARVLGQAVTYHRKSLLARQFPPRPGDDDQWTEEDYAEQSAWCVSWLVSHSAAYLASLSRNADSGSDEEAHLTDWIVAVAEASR